MQYTDYDKYKTAIESTDFNQLNTLLANINSIESDFVNKIDVDASWESSVKVALIDKINSFKTEFRKLSLESTNLNNIVTLSDELKTKIIEYKRLNTEINRLNGELSTAESHNKKVNDANNSTSSFSSTGGTQYGGRGGSLDNLIPDSTINSLKTQIKTNTSNYNSIQQEIESLIKKLQAIEFGKAGIAQTASSTGTTAQVGPSGQTIGNLDAATLVATGSGDYNAIFAKQFEQPIQSNIEALHLSQLSISGSAGLASVVITNMPGTTDKNQMVAIDLATLVLPKLNAQRELADEALQQQKDLLQRTKDQNFNKFWPGQNDGDIRELAVARDNETDPVIIAEYNKKIEAAVEKFNKENANLIPIENVLEPVLTTTVAGNIPIPPAVKETQVLSLFTESLYNSPPPDTTMRTLTDSSGNITGYEIVDNRVENSSQTYTLNIANDGYQLSTGDQGTYFYPKSNTINDLSSPKN